MSVSLKGGNLEVYCEFENAWSVTSFSDETGNDMSESLSSIISSSNQ